MKPGTRSFYADVVQAAIAHIASDLEVAINLTALARGACLSPFHFHRIFRGMVGETPLELRRRLCLERAAWRLAREDTGVTAIALDAGYDTHEAFTRAFRARFGTSPSGFRRRTYRRFELATPCGVHYIPTGGVVAFTPRNSGGENMTVDIEEMPTLRVAAVRHIGPYNHIGQAFERLGAILGGAGLLKGPPPMMLAIYYDNLESHSGRRSARRRRDRRAGRPRAAAWTQRSTRSRPGATRARVTRVPTSNSEMSGHDSWGNGCRQAAIASPTGRASRSIAIRRWTHRRTNSSPTSTCRWNRAAE